MQFIDENVSDDIVKELGEVVIEVSGSRLVLGKLLIKKLKEKGFYLAADDDKK